MRILSIDIGGTKIQAALADGEAQTWRLDGTRSFSSSMYSDLTQVIREFLEDSGSPVGSLDGVAIGIAGPVMNGRAKLTNLPWGVDAAAVSRGLNGLPVHLMNDLEAHGFGVTLLDESGLHTLRKGKPKPGNRVLIAAGTGLGESILFWDGARHLPSPSEGSHASFSPCDDEQIELLRFLLKTIPHVSWERVVSGKDGFKNLYEFLTATDRAPRDPELHQACKERSDLGELIVEAAARGVEGAVKTLRLFVRLYGAEAGNLALKGLGVSGIYLGGGIAPKILKWMDGSFLEGINAKGRFRGLLQDIPVKVITDPLNALRGAAFGAALKWNSELPNL